MLILQSTLPIGGAIGSEAVIVILIAVVLFLIFHIGKTITKTIVGLITNSVFGLVSIFVLNQIFGISIPLNLGTIASTVLFGLPAVGTMIIIKMACGVAACPL